MADELVEQAKRLRLAETLVDVSRTVAAMETLDEVLASLVELTARETEADRGTLFLNDPATGELYSRVAQGHAQREIRLPNDTGIAGARLPVGRRHHRQRPVRATPLQPGHRRPDRLRDAQPSLCVPIRTRQGGGHRRRPGAEQARRRRVHRGRPRAARGDDHAGRGGAREQPVHRAHGAQAGEEIEFLDLVSDITSEIDLGSLLQRIMGEATRHAERRALHAVPQRREEQRAVVAGRRGQRDERDPLPDARGHRRRGVHLRQDDQHPVRLRRPALQPGLRQADRATSRARSCACRSSTRPARPSASRRC